MRIQVNSDKNIPVDIQFKRFVREEANRALGRFKDKLTRVEFHLSDVNSRKFGKQDKRCLAEARPAGHKPLAVTAAAATVDSAVRGSLSKLRSALGTFFGRMKPRRRGSREATAARASGRNETAAPPRKRAVATAAKPAKPAAAKKAVAGKVARRKPPAVGEVPRRNKPTRRGENPGRVVNRLTPGTRE